MPSPGLTFDALSNQDNQNELGFRVRPPDTEGDVGPNHYVSYINLVMQVYNKSGVPQLPTPFIALDLFGELNGPAPHNCEEDLGDPLVHYDQLADRWVLSQFAFDPNTGFGPYYECVAVSETPDPTGSYCVYAFLTSPVVFPDYPKMGVWPDAYYFSFAAFPDTGVPPMYPAAMAVERAEMLKPGCPPADMVYFDNTNSAVNENVNRMLPTDLDGSTLPPPGEPNYFYTHFDDPANVNDHLEQWEFHVDWAVPANSTFTKLADIPVTAFDMSYSCSPDIRQCIPQQGTTNKLDIFINPGRGRLMYEANYRNFGTHRSVVLTHSVDAATNLAAVRWYELRNPEGTPTVFQQSTYHPNDGHQRWMQSAAMDKRGDLAIGYSASSATLFPSLRYAGRLVTDPVDQLTQGESTLFAGGGSQLFLTSQAAAARWGDYTRLTVDPTDDCTFWFIGQYYAASDGLAWRTRVGNFVFPECLDPTAVQVRSFAARWRGKAIDVRWQTAAETSVAGFHLYRSVGTKPFRRVNATLIRAKESAQARGADYRFVDRTVRRGRSYSYRLQVVSTAGKRTWHSIGSAASG
jgi:hypothetical protein